MHAFPSFLGCLPPLFGNAQREAFTARLREKKQDEKVPCHALSRALIANETFLRHIAIDVDMIRATATHIVDDAFASVAPPFVAETGNRQCTSSSLHQTLRDRIVRALQSNVLEAKDVGTTAERLLELPAPVDAAWVDVVPERLQRAAQNAIDDQAATASDRDIVNYIGAVIAIDFRHWVSGSFGDAVTAVGDLNRRRNVVSQEQVGRASFGAGAHLDEQLQALLAECVINNNMITEPNAKQYYYARNEVDQENPKTTFYRGSMGMMMSLKDAVDKSVLSGLAERWFDPAKLVRPFSTDVAALLFSGVSQDVARAQAPGIVENVQAYALASVKDRVEILGQIGAFYADNGKDFYDLLVESKGELFGEGGFLNALMAMLPRFRDGVTVFAVRLHDGAIQWFVEEELPFPPQDVIASAPLCFIKLPMLMCAALRSVSGLLHSEALAWLRRGRRDFSPPRGVSTRFTSATAPFHLAQQPLHGCDIAELDAEALLTCDFDPHLSVCMDYQIPNALRHASLLRYSATAAELVECGALLPSGCRLEVEIRLAGLLACSLLLEEMQTACWRALLVRFESSTAGFFSELRQVFLRQGEVDEATVCRFAEVLAPRVMDVDYALWFFGRTLTSTQSAKHPHHLTPGIMY